MCTCILSRLAISFIQNDLSFCSNFISYTSTNIQNILRNNIGPFKSSCYIGLDIGLNITGESKLSYITNYSVAVLASVTGV